MQYANYTTLCNLGKYIYSKTVPGAVKPETKLFVRYIKFIVEILALMVYGS